MRPPSRRARAALALTASLAAALAVPGTAAASPEDPTGLVAVTPTNTAPQLTWDPAGDWLRYRVYRDGDQIGRSDDNTYSDAGLAQSGEHVYTVRAVNPSGEVSGESDGVSVVYDVVAPAVPAGLETGLGVTSGAPGLRWEAALDAWPADGEVTYRIVRDGVEVDRVVGTVYDDLAALEPGAHVYQVEAEDAAGNVTHVGTPVTVAYDPGAPWPVGAPVDLSASASALGGPTLTWAHPERGIAAQYIVVRDGVELGRTTEPTFTDPGPLAAGAHVYEVRAMGGWGNVGAPSEAVTYEQEVTDTGPLGQFRETTAGIHLASAIEVFAGQRIPDAATAERIARTFDVIAVNRNQIRGYEDVLQRANPDLIMYVYENAMFAQRGEGDRFPAAWYMRTRAGDKVRSDGYGNWLMDPRSTVPATIGGETYAGWSDWVRKGCAEEIAKAGPGVIDGCFLDMMGTAPLDAGYCDGGAVPWNAAAGRPFTDAEWYELTGSVGRAVSDYLRTPVIGNGLGNGSRFAAGSRVLFDSITAGMAEIWLRPPTSPITAYPGEDEWRRDVQMLLESGKLGRAAQVTVKTWTSGSEAEKEAWRLFGLASYLIGSARHTWFEFTSDRSVLPWRDLSPLYDLDLGAPLATPAAVEDLRVGGGAYRRDYERGVALVNPTGGTVRVDLGARLRTRAGATVSDVTLAPHSGDILLRP